MWVNREQGPCLTARIHIEHEMTSLTKHDSTMAMSALTARDNSIGTNINRRENKGTDGSDDLDRNTGAAPSSRPECTAGPFSNAMSARMAVKPSLMTLRGIVQMFLQAALDEVKSESTRRPSATFQIPTADLGLSVAL